MARICIDGFNLALPSGSGIATYARNLRATLASLGNETQILYSSPRKLGQDNLLNQIMLFDADSSGSRGIGASLLRWGSGFRPQAREITVNGDVITKQLEARFPQADLYWACWNVFHTANLAHRFFRRFTPLRLGHEIKTDVMHWTAPMPLFEPRIANVYTLHDMIPLRLPYTTLDNKRAYYDMCKTIAKRADRIFTVSEHSRADIIRLLGVSEDRVVNTYQSVDVPQRLMERSQEEIALELEGVFRLEHQKYFLYFGAMEPKKNLPRVVEAYISSGVTAPLVIVGPAWLNSAQKERMKRKGSDFRALPEHLTDTSDRIKFFEYLPFHSLVTLVQGARALLFPSLFEGFGLPVLEAMQLGTPVLTSNTGSLPEIAGNASLMVDPYDIDAIRRGIQTLDADTDLREELTDRGRRRATLFSVEHYRQRLQAAYASLV
jgi:glycosyltransferase involved in cell wall biosynthesis